MTPPEDAVDHALSLLGDATDALNELGCSLRSAQTSPAMTAEILTGLRDMGEIVRDQRPTDQAVRAALDWIERIR